MWEATLTILIGVILIVFIILLLKPGEASEKRQDDRDAKKSSEIDEPGGWTQQSQQPAELQVGRDRERVEMSRFKPDSSR